MKIPIKKKIARLLNYEKIAPCPNCGEKGGQHFNNGISLEDIMYGVKMYSCERKVKKKLDFNTQPV